VRFLWCCGSSSREQLPANLCRVLSHACLIAPLAIGKSSAVSDQARDASRRRWSGKLNDRLTPIAVAPGAGEKEEKKTSGTETPEQKDLFVALKDGSFPDERKSITHKFRLVARGLHLLLGCTMKEHRVSLYQNGEGRFHPFRVHGWASHFRSPWPAVWECRSRLIVDKLTTLVLSLQNFTARSRQCIPPELETGTCTLLAVILKAQNECSSLIHDRLERPLHTEGRRDRKCEAIHDPDRVEPSSPF